MITKETAMIEVNPTKPEVQLILLRSHLRLYAVGMRHSRMTGKDLLARVGLILGKTYRRGQYNQAIQDINSFLTPPKQEVA